MKVARRGDLDKLERMARQVRRRGVAAEDLYRWRFVADAQISPDGSQVAYVAAWVDPADHTRYRSQIVLVPFDGSAPPKVIAYAYGGQGTINVPSWSPDGTHVAFVSNSDLLTN